MKVKRHAKGNLILTDQEHLGQMEKKKVKHLY